MKDWKIINDNVKVVDFMGGLTFTDGYSFNFEPIGHTRIRTRDLKFHDSWDWIMPVVLRIRKILSYKKNKGMFDKYFTSEKDWFTINITYDKLKLFKKVVKFIDWYNENG